LRYWFIPFPEAKNLAFHSNPRKTITPRTAKAVFPGRPEIAARSWRIPIALLSIVLATAMGRGLEGQTGSQNVPASDQQSPAAQTPVEAQSSIEKNGIAAYEGVMVHDVQFRGAKRNDQSNLLNRIPMHSGRRFRRKDLKDSLQVLYSGGRFKNIQAEVEPQPDKSINVYFVVDEAIFIAAMHMYGAPRPPTANQLLNATKLRLGEEFTDEKLQAALDRIKRVMAENGYFNSDVRVQTVPHPENQDLEINFIVTRGIHARVGEISVEGDSGYPPERIRGIAKLHPGDEVTSARLTRALTRLRKNYQKQDRLEAQVSLIDRNYHPNTNKLDYTFKIDRGPKVDIRLEGARLRKGKIKKYVPVYEESAVDNDLLNEGQRNLRDYFQAQGYFDVDIKFRQTRPQSDRRLVVYDINRGERHKLTDLVIKGNKYFPVETIRERMNVQPADVLLRHGRFSQTLLARDITEVQLLYRANGFDKVTINSQVQDDYKGEQGRLYVELDIDEGPQTLVRSTRLEGNHTFNNEQIAALMSTIEGQPYSEYNVANDRQAIVNYYYDHGFPNVSIETQAQPSPEDASRQDVLFKISEGDQVFVDRVLVSGLQRTQPFVVNREFQIRDGNPLSQSAMVSTQQRLYDLSIFNQVDMAVQNPDGDADHKNLLYQIEEARRYTFNYGVGFEVQTGSVNSTCSSPTLIIVNQTQQQAICPSQGSVGFSPRVSFDVTRINFRGRNHTVSMKTRYGHLLQRGSLVYEQPHWFNKDKLTLTVTGFYEKARDVLTFTARRAEGSIAVTQQYRPGITLLYKFTYRRVATEGLDATVSEASLPLFSRPVRVGIPSFSAIRDHRDNPLESHKGSYNTLDVGVASSIFGSQADFSRLFVQNATYHSFGGNRKWTLARSTRLGVEEPFGEKSNTVEGSVPLPERFFSGGSSSHRGFGVNQAGPRDPETGFPIGGEGVFINNLELRTPPIPLPIVEENLSAVIFHDAGNVFTSAGDIIPSLFRISQKNKEECKNFADPNAKCDFSYVSHALGLGLRYKTPIGPVRVDLGYNLNPPTFPVRDYVQKGNNAPQPPHSETLGHFNFYFSIGQTF
jgi:outer membrane protein insertion porin family